MDCPLQAQHTTRHAHGWPKHVEHISDDEAGRAHQAFNEAVLAHDKNLVFLETQEKKEQLAVLKKKEKQACPMSISGPLARCGL